jgi:hypothetical protein
MLRTQTRTFFAVALLLSSPHAFAQRRPRPAGPAAANQPAELSPREAREALRATDIERVVDGIESLGAAPSAENVAALIDLLQHGPSDRVTGAAIEALGQMGRADAIPELSNLLRHRRDTVRVAAIQALKKITDARVRGLIEGALHDSSAQVRGEAAKALGEIGARQSVPLLFRAFERGVPEAAEAIGKLGTAEDAVSADAAHDNDDPRRTTRRVTLAMWLTHAPIAVLLPGLRGFLDRRDIAAAIKVKIIERLEQRTPSVAVRATLQEWITARPRSYAGPDLERARIAVRQIQGGR